MSIELSIKSNQKVVGYLHDVHITVVPMPCIVRPFITMIFRAHRWVCIVSSLSSDGMHLQALVKLSSKHEVSRSVPA